MGMSTNAVGIKPPDSKWKKMKMAWDACVGAEVRVPDDVDEFFNGETPDDKGVLIDIENHPCCSEFTNDSQSGFEIELERLPKGVKIIRFYNGW